MRSTLLTIFFCSSLFQSAIVVAQDGLLGRMERLAASTPKPFVVVEATGEGTVMRGQGVVVSPKGHVLTAGHICWDGNNGKFTDAFRVSFRGSGKGLPKGTNHVHETRFSDREDTAFHEHFFNAKLQANGESRFIENADLMILKIGGDGRFPEMEFSSKDKPVIELGEEFHLCHYGFPNSPADPLFFISPIEIVGVVDTSSGLQYLAKGYYRVGSSGGAILKEGRLIGIQSAGYTINTKDEGEIPLGLISFQPVWEDLIRDNLKWDSDVSTADKSEQ
jgi:hypothetical protein